MRQSVISIFDDNLFKKEKTNSLTISEQSIDVTLFSVSSFRAIDATTINMWKNENNRNTNQ